MAHSTVHDRIACDWPEFEHDFGPPAAPGELGRLGKYRVLKPLGRGNMGAVYLGYDDALRRKVALKVMLPDYAIYPAARTRFVREARAAARVRSDHVVTIHEVGEDRGIPFMAMEYLRGQSLDAYLQTNRAPTVAQAIGIGRDVATGLTAAHALGLVHRDIKPGNLWLTAPHGRVKILDFGLARRQVEDTALTQSGEAVGTPAYMSPEQARGQPVDARSDLFSLGGVLYRLVTGQLPFTGATQMEVLTRLAVDPPTPVRELNPAVPEPLAALIHQLLAKDPAARPASAEAVKAALKTVADPAAPSAVHTVYVPIVVNVQPESAFAEIGDPGPIVAPAAGSGTKSVKTLSRGGVPVPLVAGLVLAGVVVLAAAGILFKILRKEATPQAEAVPTSKGKKSADTKLPLVMKKPDSPPEVKFPPLDPEWVTALLESPPDQQIVKLRDELVRRNPQFDPKKDFKFRPDEPYPGVKLTLATNELTDVSPVGVLPNLTTLELLTHDDDAGTLNDLGPLRGSPVRRLRIKNTLVTDLSPLRDLSNLSLLVLDQTATPTAAVHELRTALPGCQIEVAPRPE